MNARFAIRHLIFGIVFALRASAGSPQDWYYHADDLYNVMAVSDAGERALDPTV